MSNVFIGVIVEDDEYGFWIFIIEGIVYLVFDLFIFFYFGVENGVLFMGYYIGFVIVIENNIIMFGGVEGVI